MRIVRLGMAVMVACALGLGGCIFKSSTLEASLEGSSDASSSPSRSSSGDDKRDALAYQRDVRDATAGRAADGTPDVRVVEKDVSHIAATYGITDWEQSPHTYVGIGQGLARAGVRDAELERFAADLAHTDARYREWIRSGYDDVSRR